MTSLSPKGKKARKRVWKSKTNPFGAKKGKTNTRWAELPGKRATLLAQEHRRYFSEKKNGH